MIRQVVLLKFQEGYSQEALQGIVDKLNTLPGKIPQVVSYTHGPDAGIMPGKYDYAVVGDFASAEDLMAYMEHPAHQDVGADITAILADAAPMQFVY